MVLELLELTVEQMVDLVVGLVQLDPLTVEVETHLLLILHKVKMVEREQMVVTQLVAVVVERWLMEMMERPLLLQVKNKVAMEELEQVYQLRLVVVVHLLEDFNFFQVVVAVEQHI
tara:strand:- start:217 stop:564 length:348 start_codon:yes stop_codon:yes gene_type:complete